MEVIDQFGFGISCEKCLSGVEDRSAFQNTKLLLKSQKLSSVKDRIKYLKAGAEEKASPLEAKKTIRPKKTICFHLYILSQEDGCS